MNKPQFFQKDRASSPRRKGRRPAGVSRRQRKQHFGFETLEERRVMSANTALVGTATQTAEELGWEVTSYSSNTLEGQLAILQQEYLRALGQANGGNQHLQVNSVPTDPLVSPEQWHLLNSGQQVGNPDFQVIFARPGEDINVAPVYNLGITGEGVVVAVIDTGVELDHPDLVANIDPSIQFDPFLGGADASPVGLTVNPLNAHGTAVAGVIAAEANNGIGGAGVAPDAQLVPIRLIFGGLGSEAVDPQSIADSFRFRTDLIDITNNSWGPELGRTISGPDAQQVLALRDSIIGPNAGRDGLGTIHIFSAGDNAQFFENANYNGWINSRYTIGVTGVDHDGFYNNIDGTVTGAFEVGSSILVAAPTGSHPIGPIGTGSNDQDIILDTGIGSGIVTTDTTGDTGFNILPDPDNGQEFDRDFLDDEAYTSRFGDTSAAAAQVSGIVALMLEANPNLSWRDVQEILVRSARQNARFGEAADGADKSFSQSFANTWIQNQIPLYHDPDPWDATVSPILQTRFPTLDPNLAWEFSPTGGFFGDASLGTHYAPTPATMTNGAGYTVSQGFGTNDEWIGFAHGVVDAELAVLLSQQWTTKNQSLPNELTFTTEFNTFNGGFVPRAQNTGEDNGDFVVPGGLGGETGFIDYYAEYFDDIPFLEPGELAGLIDNERSDGPIELIVPDDNTMTVENIEITLTIDNYAEALDHLRVVLVSPNGTHSELNHFTLAEEFLDDFVQIDSGNGGVGNAPTKISGIAYNDSQGSTGGAGTFTFSTNRSWGERSDSAIVFDADTGLPVLDRANINDGVANYNPGAAEDIIFDDVLQQGWQLIFENWGDTDLTVSAIEVAWHGSPISANTERVQGFVGVDDNRDDFFNYSRVLRDPDSEAFFDDGDPNTLRLGEVINMVDADQEGYAANVTVTATRVSDGLIVDRFVTGHDGNFYFDLVPDDYIISVEDSLGRTALDDSQTPASIVPKFQSEWLITAEDFHVWEVDPTNISDVPIDPLTGRAQLFRDGNGAIVPYGVKNVNFLIDPGVPAAPFVNFSGAIFADTNGDGIYNSNDIYVPNVLVFGDVNQNGVFDSGEVITSTDANGEYTLVVPTTDPAFQNVGVMEPLGWSSTNPDSGLQTRFVEPGAVFTGVDFAIQPPSAVGPSTGSNRPGIIIGSVFEDVNKNAVRDASESGVPNVQVFLDNNSSGVFDPGDTVTTTNENGAYIFTNVPVGTHLVDISIGGSTLDQTFPIFNQQQVVTTLGDGTVNNVNFGVNNTAILDFGDLPEVYGTLFDSTIHSSLTGGARHTKGIFFLGSTIDAEVNGIPTADALGDDLSMMADEDGILVDPIVRGAVARIEATASRHGGYLQAWMDFNGDGDFDDVIDGVSERVITNELLAPGLNIIDSFSYPATIDATTVYARFRYGDYGLGQFGFSSIGEVEDYALSVAPLPSTDPTNDNGPDFDGDGDVDGMDFLTWQLGYGSFSPLASDGDANDDGEVDADDLTIYTQDYGAGLIGYATSATTDFDGDGDTDGADFLALQLGMGMTTFATLSDGDGNQDGSVDVEDLYTWGDAYGAATHAAIAASEAPRVAAAVSSDSEGLEAPMMSQPYFREEFVVDSGASSENLASVASEAQRIAAERNSAGRPLARVEYRTYADGSESTHDPIDVDTALSAGVLDRLYSASAGVFEEIDPEDSSSTDADEVLAAAFGDETNWRL